MIDNNNNKNGRNDKLLLVGTILLIFSLLFITFRPMLTGFNTLDGGQTTHIIGLNRTYTTNTVESLPIMGMITSIKLNGSYSGEFRIWLNAGGQMLLLSQSESTNNQITGMDVLDVAAETSIDSSTEAPEESLIEDSSAEHVPETIVEDVPNIIPPSETEIIETSDITEIVETNETTEDVAENISMLNETTANPIVNTIENFTENISIVELPLNNSAVEIILPNITEQNITINITEPNITQDITENVTENVTQNTTITKESTSLSDSCVDTCLLQINITDAMLIVELADNSTVTIASIVYTAKGINHPPALIKDIADIYLNDTNKFSINLSEYFVDEDGDNLTFESVTLPGIDYMINNGTITYSVSDVSINYSMFVYATDEENLVQSNIFKIIPDLTSNETFGVNITVETIQYPAMIGEPVRWVQKVHSKKNITGLSIDIPSIAMNVSVMKESGGIKKDLKNKMFKTKIVKKDKSKDVVEDRIIINDSTDNIEAEYYTEAPGKSEKMLSKNRKEVVVSSSTHYTDVIAYADLPMEVSNLRSISLKWKIKNDSLGDNATNIVLTEEELSLLSSQGFIEREIPFIAYDTNSDSLYDKIEWIAPHLSNQTFEIIIITKATHFDSSRNYLSDVYDQVKSRDDIWTEVIPSGDYIRVTFEKNLTNKNDITIYARSVGNNSASIDVYRENGNDTIARFEQIQNENTYKIYLTSLNDDESRDTFDLKVSGDIEFDYILDPLVLALLDDCNGATINNSLWENLTTAGDEADIYASGGYYYLNSTDAGETTLTTNTSKTNLVKYIVEASPQKVAGTGRGWHFGIGTGALFHQTFCQTNTGWSPTNGYAVCILGPYTGQTRLYRLTNGLNTTLANISWVPNYASFYNFTFVLNSSGVFFFVNNTLLLNSSDTTYSQGYITLSTGGGGTNQGRMLINNVWGYESDEVYPIFSNYQDNNRTLIVSGTGLFNVTVDNTNGTVLLEINNTNITATNLSGNVYNASYVFVSNGSYSYKWHSWGNGTGHNYNVSDTRAYVVSPNYPPNIAFVQSIAAADPIEYSSRIVSVNFTVSDDNGNFTINISNAKVIVNKSGITRQSAADSCAGTPINATAQNITCNVSMQYYDVPGVWSVNISISDNSGNYVQNTSTTFTYNILYAVSLNTNLLDFGALNAGDVNKTAGTLLLNNTGNFNYTLIQLKAYDLVNSTYVLSASNFMINVSNFSVGNILSNNTFVNITGATLPRGTDSGVGNESMYIYVDIPLGTAAKKFNQLSDWVLSLS